MKPKVIKTEEQYEEALARIEELMDAQAGTPEGDEFELLSTLVDRYEQEKYPIDLPDPIEAIKFRMEQLGLGQKDLIPFIGSRSKVSEVLNGKRPLSLKMMRHLHTGLGIPAEVLLHQPEAKIPQDSVEWDRFPVAEMAKRGWFTSFRGKPKEACEYAEDLLREFFSGLDESILQPALPRQHVRSGSAMDLYALCAWRARVLQLASELKLKDFTPGSLTTDFMRQLVGLSYLDEGPRLAGEYLAKNGIALVTLRHLPQTHLDGAAMMAEGRRPVVALTLRYDRLDNFWFTLCHELGHIALHLHKGDIDMFIDDLSAEDSNSEKDADVCLELEKEADDFASKSLIPPQTWREFENRGRRDPKTIKSFAASLRIHPAIIAGRIRHQEGNYQILSSLVGRGRVRCRFENIEGAVGGHT
jgi:HTH-type transcriptional regulator/antitoxin HigA